VTAGRRTWVLAVAGCAAVAVASLAVPATLGYDPWAWLVWGREVGRWSLDTTGGPSWKPLPVAVTALLAPLPELAAPVYAVLARTAALLCVVAVAALARRLGGRWAAVVAAAALWLSPDGDPRFLRLVLEAHEAPWSAALAVAAGGAHLAGRHHRTLAALWALSMLRPEAWPFLLAHVAWTSGALARLDAALPVSRARRSARSDRWASPQRRSSTALALAALASVPLAWFVPDWIGSGSPLHGAGAAQVLADVSVGRRLLDGAATLATVVPLPVWALAAVAVLGSRSRGADAGTGRSVGSAGGNAATDRSVRSAGWDVATDRSVRSAGGNAATDRSVRPGAPPERVLAGAAAAWSVLVLAMAVAGGYAAISRFFLPAAALVCVLAGLGLADVVARVRATPVPAVALALLAGVLVAPRVLGLVDVVDEVTRRGALEADLDDVIGAAGGSERLTRCGEVGVTGTTLLRSAVAWKLDLPLSLVQLLPEDGTGTMLVRTGRAEARALAVPGTVEIARSERWVAVAARCPAALDP